MHSVPKWYLPVTITALLWNLLGCAAYLHDVTLGPEDLAAMDAGMRSLYDSRPAWAVAATAIAVWGGAAGCLGLILRRRWSLPLLMLSLLGLIVQDIGLFGMTDVIAVAGIVPVVMQGLVLVIAVALILLARKAARMGWLA
jgi:hypothetical protein